jgi:hypothetical protein
MLGFAAVLAVVFARPAIAQRADGARVVIDTTWRFDVAERRWTRPSYEGSVGAEWTERSGARAWLGTTTAPDSAGASRWRAHVGATVGMEEPTLVLRRAHGVVRLRVDLRPLARAGQRGDSAGQPRR